MIVCVCINRVINYVDGFVKCFIKLKLTFENNFYNFFNLQTFKKLKIENFFNYRPNFCSLSYSLFLGEHPAAMQHNSAPSCIIITPMSATPFIILLFSLIFTFGSQHLHQQFSYYDAHSLLNVVKVFNLIR